MEKKELMQNMRRERFFINNRVVLQSVNMLRERFVDLNELRLALSSDIEENEFIDCVNYLTECGYIKCRDKKSKLGTTLEDAALEKLEGKLTGKGIQLLSGELKDACIDGYRK